MTHLVYFHWTHKFLIGKKPCCPTRRCKMHFLTIRTSKLHGLSFPSLQWSAVRVTPSGKPRDLNFSRPVAGITKWFWFTIEG